MLSIQYVKILRFTSRPSWLVFVSNNLRAIPISMKFNFSTWHMGNVEVKLGEGTPYP